MCRFQLTVKKNSGSNGAPVIVAALQSPHLLNIWAKSDGWNLHYDLLGDHGGLHEAAYLNVPSVADSALHPDQVEAVLVTSPLQLENARNKYIKSQIFWVLHTGYFLELLPSECAIRIDGIIALTVSVLNLHLKHNQYLMRKPSFVIPPFYDARANWQWCPKMLWTIRSRPSTRMAISRTRFSNVINGIKAKTAQDNEFRLFFFGQDAPDGYLPELGKQMLYSSCSAYISALPESAGFGLAEHEAMANGVPIVGSRWGDISREIHAGYPSLVSDEDDMIRLAIELTRNKELARKASQMGLEYIRCFRSESNMNSRIDEFTDYLNRSKSSIYPPKRTSRAMDEDGSSSVSVKGFASSAASLDAYWREALGWLSHAVETGLTSQLIVPNQCFRPLSELGAERGSELLIQCYRDYGPDVSKHPPLEHSALVLLHRGQEEEWPNPVRIELFLNNFQHLNGNDVFSLVSVADPNIKPIDNSTFFNQSEWSDIERSFSAVLQRSNRRLLEAALRLRPLNMESHTHNIGALSVDAMKKNDWEAVLSILSWKIERLETIVHSSDTKSS